jgi:hypothetical protein
MHARRNDCAARESYGRPMPIALAYALAVTPFVMLGFGLARLSRA